MSKLAIAALAMGLSACSVFAVKPPPQTPPEHGPVRCTDTLAVPIADTVAAAGWIGLGVYGLSWASNEDPPGSPGEGIGTGVVAVASVVAIIIGAVTAISATGGYLHVSRCRRAKRRAAT